MPETENTDTLSIPEAVLVWLIEDNALYRDTIKTLLNQLERFNCTHTFASCEEALAALETEISPDVLLMDIGLPGMSGIEGIPRFKQIIPSTQIIILTVYDDDEKVFDALCAGASGYLLKNSTKEKIVDSINEVLQGGAPMNMSIAKKVLNMFGRLSTPKTDYGLTAREKEILQLVINGLTKKKIADQLFLSYHTINAHLKNIYTKLHVNTRTGAVSKAFRENLL